MLHRRNSETVEHTGAIKLLVALGVTIAVGNEGEWTPLNTAAEDGKFHAVKLLLD